MYTSTEQALKKSTFKFLDQREQAKQIAIARESNHRSGDSVENVRHNNVLLVKIYLRFVDPDVLLQCFQ
jgi:hypothetical protein